MSEIKAILTEYGNIVALLFGIVGQLLSEEKPTKRFMVNLVWASLLLGIYLMPVVLEYVHIDLESNIAKGLYALSPMVALQLVALLAVALPAVLRDKLLHVVGVNSKELDTLKKDKSNASDGTGHTEKI